MSKSRRVRIAFALSDGPVPLVNGGWRIWTHAEDTYITAKSLRDTWKVSLHGDVHWASAVTSENARRPDTVLPPGHNRAMWRFTPTPFAEGRRDAFAIGVARHALLPGTPDPHDLVIEVPDRWDVLPVAIVRMTEPGINPHPEWSVLTDPLPLRSGRQVWVTQTFDPIGPREPEPQAVGAMVKVMDPERDDVACPGWLVVGTHWG